MGFYVRTPVKMSSWGSAQMLFEVLQYADVQSRLTYKGKAPSLPPQGRRYSERQRRKVFQLPLA